MRDKYLDVSGYSRLKCASKASKICFNQLSVIEIHSPEILSKITKQFYYHLVMCQHVNKECDVIA